MKRNIATFLIFAICIQWCVAQAPKSLEKVRRAVFSIVTYDKQDKILNTGNGFFISENGMAVSDFSVIKNAERAVVIDADGKQFSVQSLQGFNTMYDVVKFHVNVEGKKVTALPIAQTQAAVGATIYLLPYTTQKSATYTSGEVTEVSSISGNHSYYTLKMALDDKQASCPIVNAAGEAVGIAQLASGSEKADKAYAVGASYATSLTISALSGNDPSLKYTGIKMGLPEKEEDALVYLFMAYSTTSSEEYATLLNDFIATFPNSSDGYIRRANFTIGNGNDQPSLENAEADIEYAVKIASKKDETLYQYAKLIYNYQLTNPETTFKNWTFDRALSLIQEAKSIDSLPLYTQTEGDIYFAQGNYEAAYTAYEKVNNSNMASAASFYSAARAKELMGANLKEVVALLDSCVVRSSTSMTESEAPYLLERARLYMATEQYRPALLDYDAYYNALRGNVGDLFYYYREQAALSARQYQRALDDINKAIELAPRELLYRLELAVINIRVGRNEEALASLVEAEKIDAENSEVYKLKGLAHIQLKNNEEGCQNLQKAKELGSTNVDSLIEKHCK